MTCPHHDTVTLPQPANSKHQNDSKLACSDYSQLCSEARKFPIFEKSSLIEDMFSDEVLLHGIGKLKYPDDSKAASEFSLDVSEMVKEVESRVNRILESPTDCKSPARLSCRIGEVLNEIGDAIRKRLDIPSTDSSREFTCRFGYDASSPNMPTMDERRKPELATFECGSLSKEEIYWEDVECPVVIEETYSYISLEASFEKLLAFACRIFSKQFFHRRFVVGVAIIKNKFSVLCFDRSGGYMSVEYDIKTSPLLFARIIAGLLFADKTDLGYDGSVLAYDDICRLSVNEKGYYARRYLHKTSGLLGTGVFCLQVERHGEEYVIKDVWLNRRSKSREQDILERIQGVENVARLVSHEVLKTRTGAVDSTELRAKEVFDGEGSISSLSKRVTLDHHRFVIAPYGMPFRSFSSLEELISAMRDVVKAIKDLSEIDVLHADISSHNVVLVPHSDPSTSLRKACLIDFGCSIDLREPEKYNDISGTPFFMSLNVGDAYLLGEAITRKYIDDLESVLYMLCYMCINYHGPNSANIGEEDFMRSLIPTWCGDGPNGFDRLAYSVKSRALKSKASFRRTVLTQFRPYFNDLHACAEGMYDILFPSPSEGSETRDLYGEMEELGDNLEEAEAEPESEARDERIRELSEAIDSIKMEITSRSLHLQSPDHVFTKMFKVLDDTLDMLRQKTVDSKKEQEDAIVAEETSAGQQDEDCVVKPCEPNSSAGEEKTVEEPKLAQEIDVAVATESSSGVLEEKGKEESANISQASEDSCGQVDNCESADAPKDTAEAAVAYPTDDSCQRSKCKGEGRAVQVVVPMVVAAASERAPCQRGEGTGMKGVPKDSSCGPFDASCERQEGKRIETPAASKRKRIEEDEESDSEADSGRCIRKRRKLQA